MGSNPSNYHENNRIGPEASMHPVEHMKWNDCQEVGLRLDLALSTTWF
jgi:hypothetical protein